VVNTTTLFVHRLP